ncbi:unnamed protein product [Lactuca saligna]|uniref:Uncharacterized protein n=1 Tax=Lactuca saligna TaxID=75948 RepID=A0AA35VJE3_LACSI|nr:unnamed protein product [Lactuca saligna]
MDEVFEPETIDVQVDDSVKTKSVSRCKYKFLNVLCEESDDELVEGQMECDETDYWRKKCDLVRLVAVCASDPEKCPFMVRASWMSTKNSFQGLVEATKEILPYVEHRQCVRHIYANFRKVYSGIQFRNMFWAASKSTTEGDFKINMDRDKTLSEENRIVECFNAVIVDARKKPLLAILEEIRLYMMERTWYAVPSGVNSYEIRNGFQSYGVDLEDHYFSCRLWEIAGIP